MIRHTIPHLIRKRNDIMPKSTIWGDTITMCHFSCTFSDINPPIRPTNLPQMGILSIPNEATQCFKKFTLTFRIRVPPRSIILGHFVTPPLIAPAPAKEVQFCIGIMRCEMTRIACQTRMTDG